MCCVGKVNALHQATEGVDFVNAMRCLYYIRLVLVR